MLLNYKYEVKQLIKIQNIHTRIANQRSDFLYKQSFQLSKTYSVIRVKPHFTSQDCSTHGSGNRVKKSLSVRIHICIKCGTILDRDHNEAINIKNRGLALL